MNMKKQLFPILSAGLCAVLLFCGFEVPDVEEPPAPPVYTMESLSQETFESDGRILETSVPVPSFEINIPVQVVDSQGTPIPNAGITASHTYQEQGYTMRLRPSLTFNEPPVLTDHEGRAIIPYKGEFFQATLFAVGPDALAENWGKFINSDSYPSCSARVDVNFPASGPMEEVKITLPESGKANFSGFSHTVSLARGGKDVDYLVCLINIPSEPVRSIAEGPSPLPYERLVTAKGKVSFPNLAPGNWKAEIYDYKNMFDDKGAATPVSSYTFSLDSKNPHKKAIVLLPEK